MRPTSRWDAAARLIVLAVVVFSILKWTELVWVSVAALGAVGFLAPMGSIDGDPVD